MTKDNYDFCLILVTVRSEAESATLANALLTEKLAACINILPIRSCYFWQGEIQNDQEWQLLIKTRSNLFEKLAERVKILHSYDVPEIIAVPIVAGSVTYLNWIADNTQVV